MKLNDLLRHLRRGGCSHALWMNPSTGQVEAVPRHVEIGNVLARKLCPSLSVPEIGRENK